MGALPKKTEGDLLRYGHFDDERREYVIERPDTPLPWINYLGTEAYFGIVSNTAGGYSFYRDAKLRRLTRYRYNNAPFDLGGRYLYVRDDVTGDFWSPSWQPTRSELDDYECRHGLSYTQIASSYRKIRAETLYFVPLGETLEVWRVRVTNERDTAAELSLFSSVEFCLWDAQDDATNFQRNFSTGQVEVADGVIYHKTEYRERRDHFAYFACSEPLAGFDTQRESFLGAYRGWDNPEAVERGAATDSLAHGWQPIGSHHVRLGLAPGETREISFVLGYAENPRDDKFDPPGSQTLNKRHVRPVIERWLRPETVEEGFATLRAGWDKLLGGLHVSTPDADTNRMVNVWNAYQNMMTFNLSRSTSFFESGIGRGMGFRDSNQDLVGFVHMVPERARERILDIAATQMATGGAYHQYQPLTKRGNNDIGDGFNDDPLWLILGVAAYVKETGDASILDEPVPYDNEPGSEAPLYEHLQRSLRYTQERLGPHGLPLIGRADWNDCLNLNCFSDTPGEPFQTTENVTGGTAESVFIAGQFVLAAKELAGLAGQRGLDAEAAECLAAAEKMTGVIVEHGWDGAWFRRAYDFYGNPIGSGENDEGQIFIEPQGMCVLGGVGLDDGLAAQALDSVAERLATPHGIVLQQPAYTSYRIELGEISSYPPGYKENAGIFCHTNPWIMIAEAMTGNGDRAFDYYRRINPSAREAVSEVHRCEPYVYAQMIAGKDAPTHGEAKNSWLTGTAAWNYVAITQWILGIRPELDGLRIDPVLPSDWPGFTATRVFRGATYEISVRREAGHPAQVIVDGAPIDGVVVPPAPAGATVRVEVVVS
ncbi:glycosyl transferase [Paractinoplanes abujensis]|uniref:Cellobiose phosphorylase n=1 Tax=Paractinoplanes abujensis TaxID=882441 RepID=A0A7W7CQX6_9ACTN|nr:glycosyl transferase [Actinoplanes abujensis]MBB4692794.1 cellobiose phosphorylase [Actinoplanes abujensis]GID22707.1 glycosyl transferase [Actinoplanes abujensis]